MTDTNEDLRLKGLEVLYSDLEHCRRMLKRNDSQFWRRSYVRTFFSTVEGIINTWKAVALSRHLEGSVNFSSAEVMLLEEKEYKLNDRGKIYENDARLRTLSNLRFTFAIYAKAYKVEYELDCNGIGWRSFREVRDIRNRLTHPKTDLELDISDQEVQTIRLASNWLAGSKEQLQELAIAKLREETKQFKKATKRHLATAKRLAKKIERIEQAIKRPEEKREAFGSS